jgi:HEAT repeat protein
MAGSVPEDLWPGDPVERAAAAAAAGLRRPAPAGIPDALARLVHEDADPRVRAAALGALARLPDPPAGAWARAADDPDPSVRRRAADLAPAFADPAGTVAGGLLSLLADAESAVAEAAAWALGELGQAAVEGGAVRPLAAAAMSHGEPLVREAAVAALGALGDPGGLEAVLAACRDKPAIRRRAVLALAAFDGPEVDAALQAALDDKDWQTRQAAEDLLG